MLVCVRAFLMLMLGTMPAAVSVFSSSFFLCGGVFGGEEKLHGKMLLAFFIRKFVKFPTAACGLGSARKTI